MCRLTVLTGISGSGKSTFAAKQVQANFSGTTIVNRDKIRELIYGYTEGNIQDYYKQKGLGKLEKEVTKIEDTLICEGLAANKNVIVDATHLTMAYLEKYKYWNVPTTLVWFGIELNEALFRDYNRGRTVGEEILEKQYSKYVNLEKSFKDNPIDFTPEPPVNNPKVEIIKPSCVIFDIDGTLAINKSGRSPYDWKRVGEDTIDAPTVNSFMKTDGVKIICTGRDGVCLEETKEWLDKWGITDYEEIYIRPEGNTDVDWKIKENMWREIAGTYHIDYIVEDRLQVVRRARALGLKVFNVEYNNF